MCSNDMSLRNPYIVDILWSSVGYSLLVVPLFKSHTLTSNSLTSLSNTYPILLK